MPRRPDVATGTTIDATPIVAVREPITIPRLAADTPVVAITGIVNQIPAPPKPANPVPIMTCQVF